MARDRAEVIEELEAAILATTRGPEVDAATMAVALTSILAKLFATCAEGDRAHYEHSIAAFAECLRGHPDAPAGGTVH